MTSEDWPKKTSSTWLVGFIELVPYTSWKSHSKTITVNEKDQVLIILPESRKVFIIKVRCKVHVIRVSRIETLDIIYDFVENNIQQNIEEGIEEAGLDFSNYHWLSPDQISIELTTDEHITLRRQAFEDAEIEPSGPIQQNGEFPPVVQRFNLNRLLMMPDDFGDIKQISLDIEFLTQARHEYKKQLLSSDLRSITTTTQNVIELTHANQFFKNVNIFQTAISNRSFQREQNYVRIMAGIQLEKLFDFHWPHESPQNFTGMVPQNPQPSKKEFIFLLDTRRIMFSYLKEMKNSVNLMLQSLPRNSKFNIYRKRFQMLHSV